MMERMRDSGWTKDTKEAEEINEEDIRWEIGGDVRITRTFSPSKQ